MQWNVTYANEQKNAMNQKKYSKEYHKKCHEWFGIWKHNKSQTRAVDLLKLGFNDHLPVISGEEKRGP